MASRSHKLITAGTAVLISEPVLAVAHAGGIGVLVGLALGAIAYNALSDIESATGREISLPVPSFGAAKDGAKDRDGDGKPSLFYRLLNGKSTREQQEPEQKENQEPQTTETETGPQDNEIDKLFTQARDAGQQTPCLPRLKPNDIIRHTEIDSFQICIGRSLTEPGNPPVWINFYQQHLKIIGASQFGKSSMAAYILYAITRTHRPESVLLSVLDMENKTGKLFTDCAHLAQVTINNRQIVLHAKSKSQVLEHLGYIIAIMEERYTLSEIEAEQEPILLVYLEEFIALKEHYKHLIDGQTGEAREQAKSDYSKLVYTISEIARRGLKVNVQLLVCAQVDYADDDFREAFANITSGMSFCVKREAAQAAGFYRTDLLKTNMENKQKGQCVAETPEGQDLILAPDFDLKKKLRDLSQKQQAQQTTHSQRQSILTAVGSSTATDDQDGEDDDQDEPEETHTEQLPATPAPAAINNRLTRLHKIALEYYKPGIGYRQLGELIGTGKDKAGELIKDLKRWGYIESEIEA